MATDDEPTKDSHALIHIDGASLGEAAKVLVKKMREAVGGLARPWRIGRIEAVEADSKSPGAIAGIHMTSLECRAAQRLHAEEEAKQANMEAIAGMAVLEIKSNARPDKIECDWLVNFFDKSRLTSDEEMQRLWAAILAGEANAPGLFSKRTVNLMASLDKSDAEHFQALCRFNWRSTSRVGPIIFDPKAEIFRKHGISWSVLAHLSECGLLWFGQEGLALEHPNTGDIGALPSDIFLMEYDGKQWAVNPGRGKNSLPIGRVRLSRHGSELARICAGPKIDGYLEHVFQEWEALGARIQLAVDADGESTDVGCPRF